MSAAACRWWSRRVLAAVLLALPLMFVHAAGLGTIHGTDVTGKGYGGDFQLTDQNGSHRNLADFHGKLVLLFFGYTHCPDFCPTTLAKLAKVMKRLGPDAGKVQVLFVTIDPERDTEELLRNYVPQFNPTFLGLRGSAAQTDAITKAFHARYQIIRYRDEYLIDHTASGYLIDPRGEVRVSLPYSLNDEQIVEDIQAVLADGKRHNVGDMAHRDG